MLGGVVRTYKQASLALLACEKNWHCASQCFFKDFSRLQNVALKRMHVALKIKLVSEEEIMSDPLTGNENYSICMTILQFRNLIFTIQKLLLGEKKELQYTNFWKEEKGEQE